MITETAMFNRQVARTCNPGAAFEMVDPDIGHSRSFAPGAVKPLADLKRRIIAVIALVIGRVDTHTP